MKAVIEAISREIEALHEARTYKHPPVVAGKMGAKVRLSNWHEVVNFCSNDYLGLAAHPRVIEGAHQALELHGNGTASVRFICGTMTTHLQLERAIARFVGMERATTYVSCWNANEALVPTLLANGGTVISDALNHASIIDACRLAGKKVQRLVYGHNDMDDLTVKLRDAADSPQTLIITDGVFSMEGDLANLPAIVELGERHDALVAVDDSHAHGVLGKTGRGTPEHFGVNVDIVTGTFGKALGGAAGGFIAGPQPVIELMEQRSRPQIFSNALAPSTAGGALAALRVFTHEPQRLTTLRANVAHMRNGLRALGYTVLDSPSAIVPIIVGETVKALRLAREMLKHDILITGFGYPVVPEGAARLRAQISAGHTRRQLDHALSVFKELRDNGAGV